MSEKKARKSNLSNQPTEDFPYLEELMAVQSGKNFRFYGPNFTNSSTAVKDKGIEKKLITKIVDSGIPLTLEFKQIAEKTKGISKETKEKAKDAPIYTYYATDNFMTQKGNEGFWKLINEKGILNVKKEEFLKSKTFTSKSQANKQKIIDLYKYNEDFPTETRPFRIDTEETNDELEAENLRLQREAAMLETIDEEEEIITRAGLVEEEYIKQELQEAELKQKAKGKFTNNAKILQAIKDPKMTYEKLQEIFINNGISDIENYENFIRDTRERGTGKFKLPLPPLSPATVPKSPAKIKKGTGALTPEQAALVNVGTLSTPPADPADPVDPTAATAATTPPTQPPQEINDNSQDINPFVAGEYYPDDFEPKYHLVSILVIFGSFNPDWDTRMMENIRSLKISKDEINRRIDGLIKAKGLEMQITKRLADGSLAEYNEVCQLWAVITRSLHTGDRRKQAIVDLGQLANFSNTLNTITTTTTTIEEPETTTQETPQETPKEPVKTYTDGQMKPSRAPLTGAEKVQIATRPPSNSLVGKSISQINKEIATKEKDRYLDRLQTDRDYTTTRHKNISNATNIHQKKKTF